MNLTFDEMNDHVHSFEETGIYKNQRKNEYRSKIDDSLTNNLPTVEIAANSKCKPRSFNVHGVAFRPSVKRTPAFRSSRNMHLITATSSTTSCNHCYTFNNNVDVKNNDRGNAISGIANSLASLSIVGNQIKLFNNIDPVHRTKFAAATLTEHTNKQTFAVSKLTTDEVLLSIPTTLMKTTYTNENGPIGDSNVGCSAVKKFESPVALMRSRILSSPLPAGPPPKKPPRIFASSNLHILGSVLNSPLGSTAESKMEHKESSNDDDLMNKNISRVGNVACETVEKYVPARLIHQSKNIAEAVSRKNIEKQSDGNDSGHIYDDPHIFNNTVKPASMNAMNDHYQRDKCSLHYLSTPIVEISHSCNKIFANKSSVLKNECESVNDNAGKLMRVSDEEANAETANSKTSDIKYCDGEQVSDIMEYDQLTIERKTYARSDPVVGRSRKFVMSKPTLEDIHLFECLLLIGLNLDDDGYKVPCIKRKFPHAFAIPYCIEHLCFPDSFIWNSNIVEAAKYKDIDEREYVVPLTTETGQRKYAYCRRLQPEGEMTCSLPFTYCILSCHKASIFYFKILEEIEYRHGESKINFYQFLNDLYCKKFPPNGHGIEFENHNQRYGQMKEIIVRPWDTRLDNLQLAKTLKFLKFDLVAALFSSLLSERRVLLLSCSTSKLSNCIAGLTAALLPFEWQHTLISAVPPDLISIADICDAPTPYLIGLLKSKNSFTTQILLQLDNKSHMLAVDLDSKRIICKVGDERSILPKYFFKRLKNACQRFPHASLELASLNLIASEAFTRFFIETIGRYRNFIVSVGDNCSRESFSFQKTQFIEAASSHSLKLFLQWFTKTAAFTAFIDSRMDASISYSTDWFDQRCENIPKNSQEKKTKTISNSLH